MLRQRIRTQPRCVRAIERNYIATKKSNATILRQRNRTQLCCVRKVERLHVATNIRHLSVVFVNCDQSNSQWLSEARRWSPSEARRKPVQRARPVRARRWIYYLRLRIVLRGRLLSLTLGITFAPLQLEPMRHRYIVEPFVLQLGCEFSEHGCRLREISPPPLWCL